MSILGLWTPFTNEREMLSWYTLPRSMQKEAASYQPDGKELNALDDKRFAKLRRAAVGYANRSVEPYAPTYHHATHFSIVEALGLAAADAYANGNEHKMPRAVRQAFGLALYMHDAHHCASTFRTQALRGIYRPELGIRVSSEWVTSQAVNEFMRTQGVVFPARLFQVGVIWASTFGGATPMGRQLRLPNPEPTTIWGAIMRAADVCPPRSIEEQIERSVSITYGEISPQTPARTMRDYLDSERKFLRYVEHTFDRLDAIAGNNLTAQLGWRNRLGTVHQGLDKLERGNRRLIALLQHKAQSYHAQLT